MRTAVLALPTILVVFALAASAANAVNCPPDSVAVGSVCIDKYEASVWRLPKGNAALLQKVLAGTVTLADLTAGGAEQNGCSVAPFNQTAYPSSFPANGNWTKKRYAVSVAGIIPSACTSWFQAAQACALSGKRLPTNQEWQNAAAGTPDPGTDDGSTQCNIGNAMSPVESGSRSACKSKWKAFDMVGNVFEWVADWSQRTSMCTNWPAALGNDKSCFEEEAAIKLPGAILRGGPWDYGTSAGVFAIVAGDPSVPSSRTGFRCAR